MARFHSAVHRSRRVQHLNNQVERIREHEVTCIRQEKTIEDMRERDEIAQLLMHERDEHEDEEAALEGKGK